MAFSTMFAATNNWLGGNGSWQDKNSWSLHQRPDSDQDIVVTNAGTFTVTIDDQTASSHPNPMTVSSLTISNFSGIGTLLLTNRPSSGAAIMLTVLKDARIDAGAILKMSDASATSVGVTVVTSNLLSDSAISVVTNTSLVVTNILHTPTKPNQIGTLTTAGGNVTARAVKLGEAAGSLGTWTILDGTNVVRDTLQIGSDAGTGSVSQTGGKLIVGGNASDYGFAIAGTINSTGTVRLANGELVANLVLAIGERGKGTLIVSNGLLQAPGLDIALQSGAQGTWLIADGTNYIGASGIHVSPNGNATGEICMTGGKLDVPTGQISIRGPGSLMVSGGVVNAQLLWAAGQGGPVGTIGIAGGTCTTAFVRIDDSASVLQSGGELTVTGASPDGRIDFGQGSLSALTCSGGKLTTREVDLGVHGTQQDWVISGGTSLVQEVAYVIQGRCKINGGRLETPWLQVGWHPVLADGGGQLVVSGGEVQVTQRLYVGGSTGSTGVVNIAGGSFKVDGPSFTLTAIGAAGAGIVNVSSGSFLANVIYIGGPAGSAGTLTVSGGLVDSAIGSFGAVVLLGEEPGSTGVVWHTGGNLHARAITVGDAGFGSMFVSSNVNFHPLGLMIGNQNGSVGLVTLQGGTYPAPQQIGDLEIGVAAGSSGSIWLTDGFLWAGSGCFPGSGPVIVGNQGSGLLSATNSTIGLAGPSIGAQGTLECVNSQFTGFLCSTINNNVMRFINSTGSFESGLQNSGTVLANGSKLTFFGVVNNSGWIVATNGSVQFSGGVNNTGAVLLGSDHFRITSMIVTANDVAIFWQAFGGNRYRVQSSADLTGGFSDISADIVASGSGAVVTNFIDSGALTNVLHRFYRVRQLY